MIGQCKVGFGAQMARRAVLRLGAGGVLAAGLAACGGGGGGDSTAERQQALRDAFAKLRDGMVWTDVEALVGFPANDNRTDISLTWQIGSVWMNVVFVSTGGKIISAAALKETANDVGQYKSFNV
ncbi:hypothetical protein [Hydrogenophaga flava]|uniref:hypothetical protein n=1 Tax=Hydrogenophaga flava TaxID=65657 RepID=UPI0008271FA0|nr:hypothetical protein [Hydrogenophaga flava]